MAKLTEQDVAFGNFTADETALLINRINSMEDPLFRRMHKQRPFFCDSSSSESEADADQDESEQEDEEEEDVIVPLVDLHIDEWQSISDASMTTTRARGLRNTGNICFQNSVGQFLTAVVTTCMWHATLFIFSFSCAFVYFLSLFE
jgi:hypothetical protein